MLTTAGNLTFFASQDGMVHATNATTGEILYTFNANSSSKSGPSTYLANGQQFVAFAFGGLPTFGSAPDDNPVNHSSVMIGFSL
jgi:glucose dehydrogenase